MGENEIRELDSLGDRSWVVAPVGLAIAAASIWARSRFGSLAGDAFAGFMVPFLTVAVGNWRAKRAARIKSRYPCSFRIDDFGINATNSSGSRLTPWRDVTNVRLMSDSLIITVRNADPHVLPVQDVPGYTDEVAAAMRAKGPRKLVFQRA